MEDPGTAESAPRLSWLGCLRLLASARLGRLILTAYGLPQVRTVACTLVASERSGAKNGLVGAALRVPADGGLAEEARGSVVAVHVDGLSTAGREWQGWEITAVGTAAVEDTADGPVIVVPIESLSGRRVAVPAGHAGPGRRAHLRSV